MHGWNKWNKGGMDGHIFVLWRGYLILATSVTRGGDLVSLACLTRDGQVELELGTNLMVGERAFLDGDQRAVRTPGTRHTCGT